MEKQVKVRMFKPGEVIKALCGHCGEIRTSTFHYRDYKSPASKKIVHNVLQAFCIVCNTLTAIPDQSAPKIKEQLEDQTLPLEVRISPQLEDVIYILSARIGVEAPEMTRMVLGFYIHELKKQVFQKRLMEALTDDFADGKGTSRISLRILNRFADGLDAESDKMGLNRSQLIKAILIRAKLDLLDNADGKMARRFYDAAHLMAA